jgi:hypothetical protein
MLLLPVVNVFGKWVTTKRKEKKLKQFLEMKKNIQ